MDVRSALRIAERGLDDDELAAVLGIDRREVIRRCQHLAFQGLIIRERMQNGRIMNKLDSGHNTGDGRVYFEKPTKSSH